jgi:hypothetical protein
MKNIQINDIGDIEILKCDSGRYIAWPKDCDNVIANGDTEQEATDNLISMTVSIAQFENRKQWLIQAKRT